LLDQAFAPRQENRDRQQELPDRASVDDQPLTCRPGYFFQTEMAAVRIVSP